MTSLGAEEACGSLAMVDALKEKTAAQEKIPVDWAHMDGLSGAMVKMTKTFEGYD